MPSVGVLPALASLAGAAAGFVAGDHARALALLLLLLLAASMAAWRRHASRTTTVLLACGVAAGAAALSGDALERALRPTLRAVLDREYGGFSIDELGPEGPHDPIDVRFELVEDAAATGGAVALRGSARALRLRGRWVRLGGEGVRISVSGTLAGGHVEEWRAGRTVIAPVTFRRPARYLNTGVPDFERDLALDGTALLGSIKSGLLVEVVASGTAVQEAAGQARAHVRGAVARHVSVHDPVAAGIVTAVLIGDRTGLPPDVRDRLQAAGTYHVIAISGGNIAILVGMALLAPLVAGVRGRPAALIALAVLLGYSQIVAAEPSVWRATLMACAYLAARLVDHRTPPWHAVAVAAAVMVVVHPLDVRDPGFLLTFAATAALLGSIRPTVRWAAPALARLPPILRPLRWCAASLAASLAVEIVVMPISAHGFSRITAAGLLLNLIAVPLMAVVQIAGMATALLSGFELIAHGSGWVAYAGAHGIVESARLVDLLPWLARRVPPPGLATLVAYYAGLTLVLRSPRARRAGAALVGLSALAIVFGPPGSQVPHRSDATLRLTVFDVGQGESLLVEAPGAEPLVIDTGGVAFGGSTFDIGRRVLAPALWARGLRHVGTLLVTHGDPDHLGGAASLLEDFRPTRLWTGIPVPGHGPGRDLIAAARAAGVLVEELRTGETRAWGAARIRVLHPPVPDWERQQVRNDDSVVLEILYGDAALLLTGDIGAEVERTLVPLLTDAPLRVLKVAHHGSRTSTSMDLLDAWRPQVAVISAGRGNTFGHPTPDVLERLAAIGAEVYRTDLDGQITLSTDGRRLEVGTFVGGGNVQ